LLTKFAQNATLSLLNFADFGVCILRNRIRESPDDH
jgi:hypothetical protein